MMCPICENPACPGRGYPLMWSRYAAGKDVDHWRRIHDQLNGHRPVPATPPAVQQTFDRLIEIRECEYFDRPVNCGCQFGQCSLSGRKTTYRECENCLDRGLREGLPATMVPPGQRRPGIWSDGILEIVVTRACDRACSNCTQGSNLKCHANVMSVDQFERAVDSLDGYFGMYGVFGGNPCLHARFGELCEILRAKVPFEQRCLLTNRLFGKGADCRITFDPSQSNVNVHLDTDAYAEVYRDWPEMRPYIKGLGRDSEHQSPWVAARDVIDDEAERWKLIGQCDINQWWSAGMGIVRGELRCYFCEIALSMAALHEDDADWPDLGLAPEPGWWRKPMAAFAAQAKFYCHRCGICLRRQPLRAVGDNRTEFSATHARIARGKRREHVLVEVTTLGTQTSQRATDYQPGLTPGRAC